MTEKIKILLADDHAILRVGLASVLNTYKDIHVIGDAENGDEAISKTLKLKPDVVIMDLMMPGTDGVAATKAILQSSPSARILVLTTFATSDRIAEAFTVGALGATMKNTDIQELVRAIHTVASGKRYIYDDLRRIMAEDPPVPELSARQLEILKAMIMGLTGTAIAKQLGISHDMVREHSTVLYKKLGAANRADAVAIALRKHLLKI